MSWLQRCVVCDAPVKNAGDAACGGVQCLRYPNVTPERIQLKARCPYPLFCNHPEKCAGKGNCQAEWVCND